MPMRVRSHPSKAYEMEQLQVGEGQLAYIRTRTYRIGKSDGLGSASRVPFSLQAEAGVPLPKSYQP
jgi:hypothetical protein